MWGYTQSSVTKIVFTSRSCEQHVKTYFYILDCRDRNFLTLLNSSYFLCWHYLTNNYITFTSFTSFWLPRNTVEWNIVHPVWQILRKIITLPLTAMPPTASRWGVAGFSNRVTFIPLYNSLGPLLTLAPVTGAHCISGNVGYPRPPLDGFSVRPPTA